RYNEDLSWLIDHFKIDDIIVYNKGEVLGLPEEKLIPNVGREAETYLHYIIDNYDSLPDICVFTQGGIKDHPIPFGGRSDPHNFLIECIENAIKYGYSKNHLFTYNENAVSWGKNWNVNFGEYWDKNMYKDGIQIPFHEWFVKNIRSEYPNPINVFVAALFAVKKEKILSRPKEYYERLIKLVNWAPNCIEAHFFERSWYYIFNCDIEMKYIVARYKEDIRWLTYYVNPNQIILYNKSENLGLPNEKLIPNLGREAETYLHYIIDNYDSLPDVCIFTQGWILDHIGYRKDAHNFLMECGVSALQNGYSKNYVHFYGHDELNWGKNWNVNFGIYWKPDFYKDGIPIPFCEWFEKHIRPKYPEKLGAFHNALFAVTKKQILSNKKEYYEELIKLVNWAPNCIEAHFFERSWYYIFNCDLI
ncbi:MAG: DUF3431 domain-containing protein, partial [Bacteroidetes bacterium]|nr:DUF3431 domain-containing protein [Bacteroidota bacterium]